MNGTVSQWDVVRILVDEAQDAAAVEWVFSCVCYGEASSFRGTRVIRFLANRILSSHEYRMGQAGSLAPFRSADGRWNAHGSIKMKKRSKGSLNAKRESEDAERRGLHCLG